MLPYKKCVIEKRGYINKGHNLLNPYLLTVLLSIPFNKLPWLPQLLHCAIPSYFASLNCNQIFEGYFGSAETSSNSRLSSNFLLVDILFENIVRRPSLGLSLLQTISQLNTQSKLKLRTTLFLIVLFNFQ